MASLSLLPYFLSPNPVTLVNVHLVVLDCQLMPNSAGDAAAQTRFNLIHSTDAGYCSVSAVLDAYVHDSRTYKHFTCTV